MMKRKFTRKKNSKTDVISVDKELSPFVVATETTRMPMVFTDAKAACSPIIFANQAFLELTGYKVVEVLGQDFTFLLVPGDDSGALTAIRNALEGGMDLETSIWCRRKSGMDFRASIFLTPVRDEDGTVMQHFASFIDLTKLDQTEDNVRFLIQEINHRAQNALTTVLAIVGQTLRGVTDKATIATLEGRILALAKGHGLLGAAAWDEILLLDVLDEVLRPFGMQDRILLAGDEIHLPPKAILTFAMVVHELATNAVKHGALASSVTGRVEVICALESMRDEQQIRFRWQESGGMPVSPPGRKGFGSRQMQGLAQELNGTARLEYDSAGVICEIVMPVAREAT